MDIRTLAEHANNKFPTETDKAIDAFRKALDCLGKKERQEMTCLLVTEGIKRELDVVRHHAKPAVVVLAPTPPLSVDMPPPTIHGEPNQSYSADVRDTMDNSLKDVLKEAVYGRGKNRMTLGDANKGVLETWASDAGQGAKGLNRLRDRFNAIGETLTGSAIVNSITDANLREIWNHFAEKSNVPA